MTDTDQAPDEVDLRALLRPLRRRWWLVLGIVIVATAATYYVDARKPKVYEASTSIYVDTQSNPTAQFQGTQISVPSTNAVADLARLARSTAVGVQLKRALHSPASPEALLAQVTATPDATADFVNIAATGASGAAAAALANAYAQSFVSVGQQQIAQQLAQIRESTVAQLNALPGSGPSITAQRQPLQSRLAALRAAAANLKGPEQQLDPAVAPAVPISPRPKRAAALALFIALLNGIILVYLLEYLDRRIKQTDDIANAYELPLLGVVPHVADPALLDPDGAALDPGLVECMRFLRVNLSLQALDRPIKLLLVSSALPGEGKSTVARNLALAYREAGVDVVAVDADLRRPTLSHAFGWIGEESVGLTGVLLGAADVSEAVVRPAAHLPGLARGDALGEPSPTVGLLPSGGRAVNPPAILGSVRMAEVLQELAANHDLVIIDSPPLLAVSDTLPLLSLVDGVILIARVGHTTRDAIRRAKTALASIPTARVFGVVAEDAKSLPDYNQSSYGYGYAPQADTASRSSRRRAAKAKAAPNPAPATREEVETRAAAAPLPQAETAAASQPAAPARRRRRRSTA